LRPLLLAALLVSGIGVPAAADAGAEEVEEVEEVDEVAPAKVRRFKWMILPNVGFDTDDGLGFGARAELQRVDADIDPYRWGLVLQGFVTLRGYHHHRFHVDVPGLGRNGRIRLTLRFAYRQWLNDGYWGIGNGTFREREFVGSFDKGDPARKRYRYWLIQPFAHIAVRWDLGDSPFALFGNLKVQWTKVDTYPGSRLESERPVGMDGGLTTQLGVGFLLDTRYPEIAPERGVLAEVSARFAPAFPGSAGAYAGPFVSLRVYGGLVPGRLVLAGRVMAEWLVGDVPFFEMVRWGGSVPILGFGGFETVRGASFGRWRAPGRAVGNLELRIDVIKHNLFKQPMRWQLVPFADVGAVWGAGANATASPPDFPLHPTVGLGIHVIWAEAFVGRVDFGVGPDPIAEEDGSLTQAVGWGIYLMFDQTF